MTDEATLAVTPDAAIARYRELVRAGIQHFIVYPAPDDVETLRRLASEVMPALNQPFD
jgi:hypothetical protein